ncbi:MAG: Uma2 family endonuclease [Planctomycetota bacterium]
MATDLRGGTTTDDTVPELQAGDRLTREEFERRYDAMPRHVKAELIDGKVYMMASPVSSPMHGRPHARLVTWLVTYEASTPGVEATDNATVRLGVVDEPQPDTLLRVLPDCGGQTVNDGKYIAGPPELVCEAAASSVNYDLHEKKDIYRRFGVKEYIVWRVEDRAIDWFALRGEAYELLEPNSEGIIASKVFPGLWLDAEALLSGNLKRVLEVVNTGATSQEHAVFVRRLASAKST